LFDRLDLDYAAIGHVHCEQSVAAHAFYSGSPSPHSFGEPGEHGWWLVRLGDSQPEGDMTMVRVPSPAPQVVTITAVWDPVVERWTLDRDLDDYLAGLAGAEVRVVASVAEALVDTVDVATLEAELAAHGAGRIVVQRKLIVSERVRSVAMAAAVTVEEQAMATLDTFEPRVADDQRARVLTLVREVGAACGFTR
jgi:DNA repair exonuclease SbcCD nuclease subunit